MKKTYEKLAPFYDNLMDNSAFYHNLRLEEISSFQDHVQPAKPGQTALDAGCGTGYFSSLLSSMGYETFAVDQCRDMLNNGRAKVRETYPNVHLINADALSLPLNIKLDVIVAFGVFMNHLSRWNAILQVFKQYLKTNGLLLFDIDNFLGLDSFSQIFLQAHSASELKGWVNNLRDSIKASRTGTSCTSNWSFFIRGEKIGLYLTYYPTSFLHKLLTTKGFEVVEKRGANLFTCLLPWWMKSAAVIEENSIKGWRKTITQVLLEVDKLFSRGTKLFDLAANILFVVRKSV